MSVNGLDKAGSTPLHWAAHGGHMDCLKYLLDVENCQLDVKVCISVLYFVQDMYQCVCVCVHMYQVCVRVTISDRCVYKYVPAYMYVYVGKYVHHLYM